MPALYHFTTTHAFHHIVSDGAILPNGVCTGISSLNHFVVCLTSDISPIGHGLPDGREVTPIEADLLQRVCYRGDKYFSLDHTFVRLKVNIPDANEKLVYVPPLFSRNPGALLRLDVAGYLPCTTIEIASEEQLTVIVESFKSGHLERKSKTWWYFFGEIPLSWVTEIGLRVGHLQYASETRDVFLDQWKPEK